MSDFIDDLEYNAKEKSKESNHGFSYKYSNGDLLSDSHPYLVFSVNSPLNIQIGGENIDVYQMEDLLNHMKKHNVPE